MIDDGLLVRVNLRMAFELFIGPCMADDDFGVIVIMCLCDEHGSTIGHYYDTDQIAVKEFYRITAMIKMFIMQQMSIIRILEICFWLVILVIKDAINTLTIYLILHQCQLRMANDSECPVEYCHLTNKCTPLVSYNMSVLKSTYAKINLHVLVNWTCHFIVKMCQFCKFETCYNYNF